MKIAPLVARFEKFCSTIPWAVRLYSYPYHRVLARESALAGITKDDRVLNIGCGSIPFTALYIAQTIGAEVYAVDHDQEAADRARLCIETLGLSHRITVGTGCGEEIIPPPFTVALVALQARPKQAILANLLGHADPSVRIVLRKPRAGLEHQYDPLPLWYKAEKEIQQNMRTFSSSVLYTGRGLSRAIRKQEEAV